jgi:hypothetical protein
LHFVLFNLKIMTIIEKLENWKTEKNPLYKKEYEIARNSLAENEDLYILKIYGELNYLNSITKIELKKYFPTHSNSNQEYLQGDLYNLNKLMDWMEQDFQFQLDEIISKIDL